MRDSKIKQAFMTYLARSDDERFFQALTNFTQLPYIGVADSPDGKGFKDLWDVEGDTEVKWTGKEK